MIRSSPSFIAACVTLPSGPSIGRPYFRNPNALAKNFRASPTSSYKRYGVIAIKLPAIMTLAGLATQQCHGCVFGGHELAPWRLTLVATKHLTTHLTARQQSQFQLSATRALSSFS